MMYLNQWLVRSLLLRNIKNFTNIYYEKNTYDAKFMNTTIIISETTIVLYYK